MKPQAGGLGLVLPSGGASAAYQAGAVRALAEQGMAVAAVAGAGIGSINAAIVATAPSLSSASEQLIELWRMLAAAPPAQIRPFQQLPGLSLGYSLSVLLAAGEESRVKDLARAIGRLASIVVGQKLNNPAAQAAISRISDIEIDFDGRLEDLLRSHLSADALSVCRPLYVSAFRSRGTLVDLGWALAGRTGVLDTPDSEILGIHQLDQRDRRNAILASAAIPLLLAAQEVEGESFAAGAIGGHRREQGRVPITPLLELEGCRVIAVAHLSADSLFDRHRFPNTGILEIRPSTPLAVHGDWRDLLATTPAAIGTWIDQGYEDANRCLSRVGDIVSSLRTAEEARASRDAAMKLLE